MRFKAMTLAALAAELGVVLEGEAAPNVQITGVATLEEAGPGDLVFVARSRYAAQLERTRATAVITDHQQIAPAGVALLRVDNPYLAYVRALTLLAPPERPPAGIAPGAHVSPSAQLGAGVSVMAGAYVGAHAALGAETVLYPGVVVLDRARLGAGCLLYPGVVLGADCRLGERVILHANVSVGADGYGFVQEGPLHVKIPQIGIVEIGDDVEVGAASCIDRAALGVTTIGRGTKIDNLVMIGHGCTIGENVLIVAQSGMAGSASIGDGAVLGARAGVLGHLSVGAGAIIYSRAHVSKPLPPGAVVSGNPARPHKAQLHQEALLNRTEKLMRRVDTLEAELAALKLERAKG